MTIVLERILHLADHTQEDADYYNWTVSVASLCSLALEFKLNEWEFDSKLSLLADQLSSIPENFKPYDLNKWLHNIKDFNQRLTIERTNTVSRTDTPRPRRRDKFRGLFARKSS